MVAKRRVEEQPVLIVGGSGQIGWRLAEACRNRGWSCVPTFYRNPQPGAVALDATDGDLDELEAAIGVKVPGQKRSMRGIIRAYRASGRMFAQSFHTGTNWGKGYRPADRYCRETGYVVSWYTDPCPCSRTFEQHSEEDSEAVPSAFTKARRA